MSCSRDPEPSMRSMRESMSKPGEAKVKLVSLAVIKTMVKTRSLLYSEFLALAMNRSGGKMGTLPWSVSRNC